MKKIGVALLSLALLFSCAGVSAAAMEGQTKTPVPTAAPSTSVPFLLSEHPDTWWEPKNGSFRYLDIDENGKAELELCGYVLRVTPMEGNACALSAEFSENMYTAPVYSLKLADIRLWVEQEAVRVEITDDPYCIFSDLAEGDTVLPYLKTHHERLVYGDWRQLAYPSEYPAEQPNTCWRLLVRINEERHLLEMRSEKTGVVQGTWYCGFNGEGIYPADSVIPCRLLQGEQMAAVVQYDEKGYGEAILFGKVVSREEAAYNLTALNILPMYCAYGTPTPLNEYSLGGIGIVRMLREGDWLDSSYEALAEGDYTLVMGVDQIVADHYLTQSGWTRMDRTVNLYDDLLRRYQRDGDTLAIVFDEAYTDLGWCFYAVGYVCYGADGSVKAWAGLRPLDHAMMDQYEPKKGEPDFRQTFCLAGYFFGQDQELYFTDDMRMVIVFQHSLYDPTSVTVEPVLP